MRMSLVPFAAAAALACAPSAAPGETVTITAATCEALVEYVPAPDVEYQPGVDVHGHPVVPADLNGGSPIKVPEDITVAITVELAHTLGIPAFPDPANPQNDTFKPEASIGVVTYKDGRFEFNGQPLQSDAEAKLAKLCQRQGRRYRHR